MGPYVLTDKGLLMACDSWTSRTRRRGHQRSLGVKITHCIPPSGAGRERDKHLPHLHLKMSESRRKRGSLNNEVTSHSDEAKQQPVRKVCFTMTMNHGSFTNFSVAFTKIPHFTVNEKVREIGAHGGQSSFPVEIFHSL